MKKNLFSFSTPSFLIQVTVTQWPLRWEELYYILHLPFTQLQCASLMFPIQPHASCTEFAKEHLCVQMWQHSNSMLAVKVKERQEVQWLHHYLYMQYVCLFSYSVLQYAYLPPGLWDVISNHPHHHCHYEDSLCSQQGHRRLQWQCTEWMEWDPTAPLKRRTDEVQERAETEQSGRCKICYRY